MVNTSKILTVSYGTFSCTLEGFDDSFDTMKAIAEYFRDLASDDRYFGAEPPVPDTEMLARIAEREISRRVEAVETQGSIVLRAHSEAPQSLIADDEADETVKAATLDPIPEAAQPDAAITQTAPSHLLAEATSVANEIPAQAVVDRSAATDISDTETQNTEFTEQAYTEQAYNGDTLDDALDDDAIDEAFEGMTTSTLPAADSESVAAKLQRIRAVVSPPTTNGIDQGATDQTADDNYIEDEHAVNFLDEAVSEIDIALEADDQIDALAHETPEILAADVALEDDTVADQTLATDDDGEMSGILERLSQDADDAPEVDSDAEHQEQVLAEDLPDTNLPDTNLEDTIAASLETARAEDDAILAAKITTDTAADSNVEIADDNAEPQAETREDVAQPAAPVRARVLKVKRADFENAVNQGQLVEDSVEGAIDADPVSQDTSTLSSEDEAELLNELAMVEAELETGPTQAPDDAVTESMPESTQENAPENISENNIEEEPTNVESDDALNNRAELTENNEQDLSRILAETNTQLDEPTGRTRRSAIQHLRAAVAATKAEKAAGNDTTIKPDTSGAYRDDLASVVRPRRPVANDGARAARRPAGPGVAPLKLVAEQRIDADDAPARQPVRPRRVSLAELAAQSEAAIGSDETIEVDAGNFTEFAEAMGATKLPDLLEAAAAYLSFVEGREKFSRPQLMTKVRQVEQDDFSREDGLRSFGQLLRQGKIQKLKGGRFTVSERINYKPDERYAG